MSARPSAVPNDLFRAHRMGRGWTQGVTAERAAALLIAASALDADYVSKLERGVIRWPGAAYRQAFRDLFGAATDEELGFHYRPPADRTPRDTVATVEEWEVVDEMQRAAFVKGVVGLAFGAGLGEPVRELLRRVADDAPVSGRIGSAEVEQVELAARMAHQWDNQYGGKLAREALAGQIRWAVGLLEANCAGDTRRGIHSAVGKLAEVAGWMNFDAGSGGIARECFRLALYCAGQANDHDLRSLVLSDMARQEAYSGSSELALDIIGFARHREDRLALTQRVMLHGVEARAFAKAGKAQECMRAIGRAEELLGAAEGADDSWDDFPHTAQLYGDSGEALADLAMNNTFVPQAFDRLAMGSTDFPSSFARSRMFCLTRTAILGFTVGDPREATRVGNMALETSASLGSARATKLLRELSTAAGPHKNVPGVTSLQKRLAAAPALV